MSLPIPTDSDAMSLERPACVMAVRMSLMGLAPFFSIFTKVS